MDDAHVMSSTRVRGSAPGMRVLGDNALSPTTLLELEWIYYIPLDYKLLRTNIIIRSSGKS